MPVGLPAAARRNAPKPEQGWPARNWGGRERAWYGLDLGRRRAGTLVETGLGPGLVGEDANRFFCVIGRSRGVRIMKVSS